MQSDVQFSHRLRTQDYKKMIKQTPYEKVADQLLKGIPKHGKPFGRLIDGKFLTGHKSLHKTKQAVRWRAFWRLKLSRTASA